MMRGFVVLIFFLMAAVALQGCAGFVKQPDCTGERQECIAQSLARAREYADDNRLAKAVTEIQMARDRFPDAPVLKEKFKQYESLRRQVIFDNELELLLERGRYLLATRDNRENLFYARHDSYGSRRRYREFEEAVEQAATRLFEKGQQAIRDRQFDIAGRVLSLSNRLVPSTAARNLLAEIHLHRQDLRVESSRKEETRNKEKWSSMARDFNRAMENGNLPAARKILAEMQALKPGQVKDRRRRLENRIDREVETLLERGRFLYTRGDLQKALKTWEQGLELRPDDPKLQQNIRRARTFLDNLERWRN